MWIKSNLFLYDHQVKHLLFFYILIIYCTEQLLLWCYNESNYNCIDYDSETFSLINYQLFMTDYKLLPNDSEFWTRFLTQVFIRFLVENMHIHIMAIITLKWIINFNYITLHYAFVNNRSIHCIFISAVAAYFKTATINHFY